jgi:hypothetical protein
MSWSSRIKWAWVGGAVLALVSIPSACSDEGEFVAESEVDDIGAICAVHSDCQFGCEEGVQGAPSYCTRSCAEDPCPANYVCVAREFLGLVCAMGYCGEGSPCPVDYTCSTDDGVCRHDPIQCTSDTDCPAATACNQGECATDCWGDSDCKQGYLCHHELGCVECQYAADCPEGQGCVGGRCSPSCVQDSDCREGYECIDTACSIIQGGGTGTIGTSCDHSQHDQCEWFCRHGMCSRVCDGPDDTTTCPEGYHCDENHLVCWPDS